MRRALGVLLLGIGLVLFVLWVGGWIWGIPADVSDEALTAPDGPEGYDYKGAISTARTRSLVFGIPIGLLMLYAVKRLLRKPVEPVSKA